MSLDEAAVEKYRKKWGVSREEAEKKIKQMLDDRNRKKTVPNMENLFPEPLGGLSEKVQDVNQALLSTAYTRRLLTAPPEDINALRERIERVDQIVVDLKSGLETQIRKLTETLEEKKGKETREELLKELDNKMDPLRETLQNLTAKLENLEGGQLKGSSVEPDKILEEAEKVANKAKGWLQRQGYKVEPDRISEEQVRKMIQEAQREALSKLPPEELKKRLEKAGYKIVGGPLPWDQVQKMLKEEREKTQEEAIDDKRIEAVVDIVRDSISKIIEMFKPAVQTLLTAPEGEKSSSSSVASGSAESSA